MRSAIRRASSQRVAEALGGCLSPSRSITRRNRSRSSARSMLSGLVPMIGTPSASSALARLSGVWPPNWTITPWGWIRSQMLSTSSTVSGSKNSRSEVS